MHEFNFLDVSWMVSAWAAQVGAFVYVFLGVSIFILACVPEKACLCTCSENTLFRSPEEKAELTVTWKSVYKRRNQNILETKYFPSGNINSQKCNLQSLYLTDHCQCFSLPMQTYLSQLREVERLRKGSVVHPTGYLHNQCSCLLSSF